MMDLTGARAGDRLTVELELMERPIAGRALAARSADGALVYVAAADVVGLTRPPLRPGDAVMVHYGDARAVDLPDLEQWTLATIVAIEGGAAWARLQSGAYLTVDLERLRRIGADV